MKIAEKTTGKVQIVDVDTASRNGKATSPLEVIVDRGQRFDASAACATGASRKG